MKKVFLTGGNSFIGKNIVEQLGSKYELIAPKSNELDLTNSVDVLNFLSRVNPEIVIHAANRGGKRNQSDMQNIVNDNLRMYFNLIRGKKYFTRMIVLGSGAEYDKSHLIINVSEKDFDERVPIDQYGFSKYLMAKYAEKVDYITHLRLFGVYGKYEDYNLRLISNLICRAICSMPLVVNQNAIFDYIYVDDLVKILEMFIEQKPKECIYNIGRGVGQELVAIAEKIRSLINKELNLTIINEGLNREYTCSMGKFKNEFSDFSYIDFEQSLMEMINYYKKNIQNIDKQLL